MQPIIFNKNPLFAYYPRGHYAPIPREGLQAIGRNFQQTINQDSNERLATRMENSKFASTVNPLSLLTPQKVFWALGDNWWKQLIDGSYHKYGPYVFDEGLHNGTVEPGFYQSARKACLFTNMFLMDNLTVNLYQTIHRIACQHFRGEATRTLMDASGTGAFISPVEKGLNCRNHFTSLFRASPERYDEIQRLFPIHRKNLLIGMPLLFETDAKKIEMILAKLGITFAQALENCYKAFLWLKPLQDEVDARLAVINMYITMKSFSLGLTHPIATLCIDPENNQKIFVRYLCTKEEVDQIVTNLFADYERKMSKNNITQEEKLRNIADLFQTLDWMHPFNDGQGRTDLILLSKELCRHGFNPAILDEPYFSTFSTIDDWIRYLKTGMERWRQEYFHERQLSSLVHSLHSKLQNASLE